MKPLVQFYDGEPWFDNPQLIVANPGKKRRSSMARPHRRRRRRTALHNRRKKFRRNLYTAGSLINPHRRRSRRRHRMNPRRRRHYRRNPERALSIAGVQLPPIDAVLWVGSGLVVPPLVSAQIMKFVPASWQTSQGTTWLVKIASVVVPGMLLRKFVSPRAGNLYMVGGAASLIVQAIQTFAPGVLPGLSGYVGLGVQPMLGAYTSYPRAVPQRRQMPPMLADVPSRLDPGARF
jgi:hypothetical protein